jgi:hypothetical protein
MTGETFGDVLVRLSNENARLKRELKEARRVARALESLRTKLRRLAGPEPKKTKR